MQQEDGPPLADFAPGEIDAVGRLPVVKDGFTHALIFQHLLSAARDRNVSAHSTLQTGNAYRGATDAIWDAAFAPGCTAGCGFWLTHWKEIRSTASGSQWELQVWQRVQLNK